MPSLAEMLMGYLPSGASPVFGTTTPQEQALVPPTGLDQAVGGAINSMATLPQRAIQNSQFALNTGIYDPAVPLEAAMTTMGATPLGAEAGGASPVFGAGFAGRKVPTSNYAGPVSKYTDKLFREMSPTEALADLPTSVMRSDANTVRRFYADQPELALGQGGNRGVRVSYDAGPFEGVINKKPGWENLFPQGSAEYMASPTGDIRNSVRSFEIDPSSLTRVEKAQYDRLLLNLKAQGWDVKHASDKIMATHPIQALLEGK